MTPAEVLLDSFQRIADGATDVVADLDEGALTHRPGPADAPGNSIAWLVWHLARVQDDHVADVAGLEQVWTAQDFVGRLGLPFGAGEIGYGQSADEVGQVRSSAEDLAAYVAAVAAQTRSYVGSLSPEDLDRVVDTRWDPPVTLGVRLLSVVNDDTQHLGQAAYVRGLLGA